MGCRSCSGGRDRRGEPTGVTKISLYAVFVDGSDEIVTDGSGNELAFPTVIEARAAVGNHPGTHWEPVTRWT